MRGGHPKAWRALCILVAAAAVWGVAGDAGAQRARTPAEVEKDIEDTRRLIAIQQAEVDRIKKQRNAALDAMVGVGPKYPGMPSGWDDFSISPDMNNDAGSALVHYQEQLQLAEDALREGEVQLAKLRDEMKDTRKTPAPPPATATRPPATAGTTTSTVPPPGTAPPPATTSPPKKDMNCLCRCSCAAAGFNVNNVRSYYSTSPVQHVNPNGQVSESCMNPARGPCVCQGHVCQRAPMVTSGSCAAGCGG